MSWPRPDLAEFHLKLVAAAAARLADPIAIVDVQRRELLRRLRDAQRPDGRTAPPGWPAQSAQHAGLVAGVLLAEYLAIALVAAAAGLVADA